MPFLCQFGNTRTIIERRRAVSLSVACGARVVLGDERAVSPRSAGGPGSTDAKKWGSAWGRLWARQVGSIEERSANSNPSRAGEPDDPRRVKRCTRRSGGFVQGARDFGDDAIDGSGRALQRGNGGDGDEPDNQGVFHEVLALFTHDQGLELRKQSEIKIIHLHSSRILNSRWCGAALKGACW